MDPWLIVAGGGTAGHIVPGIVVAQELVRRGVDPKAIHFVGSERGIERTLVPDAGFDVTLLSGRGIQRRLTKENRVSPASQASPRRGADPGWLCIGTVWCRRDAVADSHGRG